ncbi:Hypothetical_protein [Hexamita inflata]|uniref:Hypothetical_protein n=1 Tax=Hexamita inflata TaxID=28002 RepID=A0AA86Q4C0_9EUKA|nr:Hypothetical protein HINF_LOCUS32994 [Hexamita inflata]
MNYLRLDQSFYQLLKPNFYQISGLNFDQDRINLLIEQLVRDRYSSSGSQRVSQQHNLTQFIQTVQKQILKFGQQFQQLEPDPSQKSSTIKCVWQQLEVIEFHFSLRNQFMTLNDYLQSR